MSAIQNDNKDLGEKDPRFTDDIHHIEDSSSKGDDKPEIEQDWTPAEERKIV
jgi:hypothetical protein